MNDLFASATLTTVFLTHFEDADVFAVEYASDGVFTGYYVRKPLVGKRTMFHVNSMVGPWDSLPKWVRLADDLYSEYLDSRFWDEVVS
jgi:hypothetical protein